MGTQHMRTRSDRLAVFVLRLAVISLMLLIYGCVHDDDKNQPTVLTQSANGLWDGIYTEEGVSGSNNVVASMYEGKIIFSDATGAIVGQGQYTVEGDQLSGKADIYAFTDAFGTPVQAMTFSGTVQQEKTFDGKWASDDETRAGTWSFVFDSRYNLDSSLAYLKGSWTDITSVLSLNFESTGNYTGQDLAGCNYSGKASVIKPEINLYDVVMTVSLCGIRDGVYSGFLSFSNQTRTAGVAIISNHSYMVIAPLLKQ